MYVRGKKGFGKAGLAKLPTGAHQSEFGGVQALKRWDKIRQSIKGGFKPELLLNNKDVKSKKFEKVVDELWTALLQDERRNGALQRPHQQILERLQLESMSLERLKGVGSISSSLTRIAQLIKETVESSPDDAFVQQTYMHKAWKILLLGLVQSHRVHRRLALLALGICLPYCALTVRDQSLCESIAEFLFGLANTRKESPKVRPLAVFFLGQLAFSYAQDTSQHKLKNRIFNNLLALMQRTLFIDNDSEQSIHILSSLGKLLSSACEEKLASVLYLAEEMLSRNECGNEWVVYAVLSLLVYDLPERCSGSVAQRDYVGAIFKPFIIPWLRSDKLHIQRLAVHFVNIWLPVYTDKARLHGLNSLANGLRYLHSQWRTSLSDSAYKLALSKLEEEHQKDQLEASLRMLYQKHLLAAPATRVLMENIKGNFFVADTESCLLGTSAILVEIPIHPRSLLVVERTLPPIKGVPDHATTVPPLYVDLQSSNFRGHADSFDTLAEKIELDGSSQVSYLPFGYKQMSSSGLESTDTALRKSPQKYPLGYISPCPYPNSDGHSQPTKGSVGSIVVKGFENAPSNPLVPVHEMQQSSASFLMSTTRSDDSKSGKQSSNYPISWTQPDVSYLKPIDLELREDFILHAPVVLEYIEPPHFKYIRIKCTVRSVDTPMAPIEIQKEFSNYFGGGTAKESNFFSTNGKERHRFGGTLEPGTLLNLYVKRKGSTYSRKWSQLVLEILSVEEAEYTCSVSLDLPTDRLTAMGYTSDGLFAGGEFASSSSVESALQLGQRRASFLPSVNFASVMETHYNSSVAHPVPAGRDALGNPYYALPVNAPAIPIEYDIDGSFKLARNPKLCSPSMLQNGATPAVLAGFDFSGKPFCVPPGCVLPTPTEFSPEGLPYYDLATIINLRAYLLFRPPVTKPQGKLLLTVQRQIEHILQQKQDAAAISERKFSIVGSLQGFRDEQEGSAINRYRNAVATLHAPQQIQRLFQKTEQRQFLMPFSMRVSLEPANLVFSSVQAPQTLNAAIKFKSARGDHTERDVFAFANPTPVFAIRKHCYRIQGEGVVEFQVTFNPEKIATDKGALRVADTVPGLLTVVDEFGQRLASCQLQAVRKSSFKMQPKNLDVGFVLPEQTKYSSLTIENTSTKLLHLDISLESELAGFNSNVASDEGSLEAQQDVAQTLGKSAFSLDTKSVKLHPKESKMLRVNFEPMTLGTFHDVLQARGPGGDLHKVALMGVAGVPLAIYPESNKASNLGSAALSRIRCDFMQRFCANGNLTESQFRKSNVGGVFFGEGLEGSAKMGGATVDEDLLMKNLMSVVVEGERKKAQTLDFGVVAFADVQRCLTLFNLSSKPIFLSLYSHSPHVECPSLLRIAPRLAITVDVTLRFPDTVTSEGQNFSSLLEIVCPEFGNIPIHVKAFIGQPLYFITWENAFFAPCPVGGSRSLELLLVNQSHYALPTTLNGLESGVSCEILSNRAKPMVLPSFSCQPVCFTYTPNFRGPVMCSLSFSVAFHGVSIMNGDGGDKGLILNAAMLNKPLRLIGIGLQSPGAGSQALNNLEFLRGWLSHPKRLLDEYPSSLAERERLFGRQSVEADGVAPLDESSKSNEVTFSKDTFKLTCSLAALASGLSTGNYLGSTNAAIAGMRKSQFASIQISNCLDTSVNASMLTSTCIGADPRGKSLPPKSSGQIDLSFVAPPDCPDSVPVYGFAAVFNEKTGKVHAAKVVARNFPDLFLVPSARFDAVSSKSTTTAANSANLQRVVLDFGKIQVSSQLIEPSVQYLHIVNQSTALYSWSLKGLSSAGGSKSSAKYIGFDVGLTLGDIQPNEMVTLPVKFTANSVGTFEASLELACKESLDRQALPTKCALIILRGSVMNTQILGLPEELVDFGSTVVLKQQKKCTWALTNNGNAPVRLHFVARTPFSFHPPSIELEPKRACEVTLNYEQKESRTYHSSLYIFANSHLYSVPVCGTAGTSVLQVDPPQIKLESAREDSRSYASVYLTNTGSLPVKLYKVWSNASSRIALEFVSMTSTHYAPGTAIDAYGEARNGETPSALLQVDIGRSSPNAARGDTFIDGSGGYPGTSAMVITKLDRWRFVKRFLALIVRHSAFFKSDASFTEAATKSSVFGYLSMDSLREAGVEASSPLMSKRGPRLAVLPYREQALESNLERMQTPVLPEIKPSMTVELKLSFSNTYSIHQHATLEFEYGPVIVGNMMEPETFAAVSRELVSSAKLSVIGHVYRPLMFFPLVHNFGLASAEHYLVSHTAAEKAENASTSRALSKELRRHDSAFVNSDESPLWIDGYGVIHSSVVKNVRTLNVTNYSWESQTFQLSMISPTFSTPARSWFLGAGESVSIPIYFHPLKEQTRYQGEAVFKHKHGHTVISLSGTGASADFEAIPSAVDFGSLRLLAQSVFNLKLINRGLLPGQYCLEILQRGSDLSFMDPQQDPGEYKGELAPGEFVEVPIQLNCTNADLSDSFLCLMSQRVPGGVWEEQLLPVRVHVGHPVFSLSALELDFGTVFIGSETTLQLEALNTGNARCHFSAKLDTPLVSLEPTSGVLEPGAKVNFKLSYTPVDFKSLQLSIPFTTDAGFQAIVCYGTVGVPYLQIPAELLDLDFGLVSIHQAVTKQLPITNLGHKRMEYTIQFEKWLLDKSPCGALGHGESVPFSITPSSGWVNPKETVSLQVRAEPDILGSEFQAQYIVKTSLGERLTGTLKTTGGSAIVKLELSEAVADEAKVCGGDSGEEQREQAERFPSIPDSATLASQSYIETLQELRRQLKLVEFLRHQSSEEERRLALVEPTIDVTGDAPGEMPAGDVEEDHGGDKDQSGEDTKRETLDPKTGESETISDDDELILDYSEHTTNSRRRRRSSILGGNSDRRTSMANTLSTYNDGRRGGRRRSSLLLGDAKDTANEDNHSELIHFIHREEHLEVLESTNELSSNANKSRTAIDSLEEAEDKDSATLPVDMPFNFEGREVFGELHDLLAHHFEQTAALLGTSDRLRGENETLSEAAVDDSAGEYQVYANRAALQKTFVIDAAKLLSSLREQILMKEGENDVLVDVIKRLQHTCATLSQIFFAPSHVVKNSADTPRHIPLCASVGVNLGFIRGKENSDDEEVQQVELFTVSNLGNMSFSCSVEEVEGECSANLIPSVQGGAKTGRLSVSPASIVVPPGESLVIHTQFAGSADGTYFKTFRLLHESKVFETVKLHFQVGNPCIVCDTDVVNFGLVGKLRTAYNSVEIRNSGSYRDQVKLRPLELANASHLKPNVVFHVRPSVFELGPNESQLVQISCTPPAPENYSESWQVLWSSAPLSLLLSAQGGAPLLRPTFSGHGDSSTDGFEFPNSIVDRPLVHKFKLLNYGDLSGTFSYRVHPFASLRRSITRAGAEAVVPEKAESTLSVDPNSALASESLALEQATESSLVPDSIAAPLGKEEHPMEGFETFTLQVNEELDFEIVFCPTYSCTINEYVTFVEADLPDVAILNIPLYAKCGVAKAAVSGDIYLKNMKVGLVGVSEIFFVNVGDLDLQLWTELELDEGCPSRDLSIEVGDDFPQSGKVGPNESIPVNLVAKPTVSGTFAGTVTLRTEIGDGPIEYKFPFSFKSFDKEVALDSTSDVNFGRVAVGETLHVSRTLYNFGSNVVKFQLAVETISGQNDTSNGWTSALNAVEELAPESSRVISFAFVAGVDSPEPSAVRVQVQYQTSGDWQLVCAFKLSGGAGIPLVELEVPPPYSVDASGLVSWGTCPINCTQKALLKLVNRGNASTSMTLPSALDGDGFILENVVAPCSDRLEVNEEILLSVAFTPKLVNLYRSSFVPAFSSSVKFGGIHFEGQGAAYMLDTSLLPKSIDFKEVVLGSSYSTATFTLTNGSQFDTELVYTVKNLSNIEGSTVELYQRPKKISVPANGSVEQKVLFNVPVPQDELGRIQTAKLGSALTSKSGRKAVLQLAFSHDPSVVQYEIPINVECFTLAPIVLSESMVSDSESLHRFDLGVFKLEVGGGKDLYLVNNNSVPIQLSVAVIPENDPYKLLYVPGSLVELPASSASPMRVCLSRYPAPAEGFAAQDMPSSVKVSARLCYSYKELSQWMPPLEVMVDAVLVEDPLVLNIVKAHDFGVHFVDTVTEFCLEFVNPLKRTLTYKLAVDSGSVAEDSFTIDSMEPIKVLPLSKSSNLITFSPKSVGKKKFDVHMETDNGVFSTSFSGSSIAAAVKCEQSILNFGTVGVGEPEFRLLEIYNPCVIPITVTLVVTGKGFSAPTQGEIITIDADDREFAKVHYNPTSPDLFEKGLLVIRECETSQKVILAQCELEGTGGTLKFSTTVNASEPPASVTLAVDNVPKTQPLESAQGEESKPTTPQEAPAETLAVKAPSETFSTTPEVETNAEPAQELRVVASVNICGGESEREQYVEVPALGMRLEHKVVRLVEVENTGTATLELQVQNTSGLPLDARDVYMSDNQKLLVQVEPTVASVPPLAKQVFAVSIDSLAKPGNDQASIVIATTSLVEQRSITFDFEAHISQSSLPSASDTPKSRPASSSNRGIRALSTGSLIGESVLRQNLPPPVEKSIREETGDRPSVEQFVLDIEEERERVRKYLHQTRRNMANNPKEPAWLTSIKSFVRNDPSIEAQISQSAHMEQLLADETGLWKVLLPVVYLKPGRPSDEFKEIPMEEPSLRAVVLHSLLIPPPAVPAEMAQNRVQKFYSRRESLQLDKGTEPLENSFKSGHTLVAKPSDKQLEDLERRRLAEIFVSKLERRLPVNQKKRRQ